ncbi:hypothetical protein MCHI_002923 [Candidatus Magnetoovum chiemensis]|nr:hypothetical protein MCHI_002923 [Candidatus Magnetoovum chiemensis]
MDCVKDKTLVESSFSNRPDHNFAIIKSIKFYIIFGQQYFFTFKL